MRSSTEAVIAAAAQVLARNRSASMSEIADAARISRATLHRIFPGREVMVEAIVERACEHAVQVFDEVGVDTSELPEGLRRLAEELLPSAHFWVLAINEPMIDEVPRLAKVASELEERLVEMMRRGQQHGALREDLSARWMAYFFGMSLVTAHEAVSAGVLAGRDALDALMTSTLQGVADGNRR